MIGENEYPDLLLLIPGGIFMNKFEDVRTALARAIAEYDVPDDVIDLTAKQLAQANHKLHGINVCEVGICCDFIIDGKDWWVTLPELATIEHGRLRHIEIFPWGIINPDILHVSIGQEFDSLPNLGGQRPVGG